MQNMLFIVENGRHVHRCKMYKNELILCCVIDTLTKVKPTTQCQNLVILENKL